MEGRGEECGEECGEERKRREITRKAQKNPKDGRPRGHCGTSCLSILPFALFALLLVPSMAEAGVKEVAVYSWQAAAAPKGLPAAVRKTIADALGKALNSPDVKQKFNDVGFDVVANSPAEFETFLKGEIGRWKTVIDTGTIKPE